MPDSQVWFIIRDKNGKLTIKNGLVETVIITTYVNKDGISHEAHYIISERAEEEYRESVVELHSNCVYGSEEEAKKHMPQIVK